MGKMSNKLILEIFLSLSLLVVINNCSSCNKVYNGRSGSISTQGEYGCDKEVFKIDFGNTENVKLSWEYFDVRGEMPYCLSGYLKVKVG